MTKTRLVVAKTSLVATVGLLFTRAHAADLPLPWSARSLPAAIDAACPECNTTGYTPCGSPDVHWGTRFAPHAFQGTPPRAYLPTFTMTGEQFRTLARTTDYQALTTILKNGFAKTRLVVLDQTFEHARVLPPAASVTVTFPEPLHTCVHRSERPWACCADCQNECCEKALGSPEVTLTWQDDDEQLTFHYSHTIGVSWLSRRSKRGPIRYACLTDAQGKLRSSAAQ